MGGRELKDFRKPCARTLDRPIQIFGLEPEDLVAVGIGAIAILFLVDGLLAVAAGGAAWIALMKVKAGRPAGYVFALLHRTGLLDRLPHSWRPPQVLPRSCERLSPFTGETDDELAAAWWTHRHPPQFDRAGNGGDGASAPAPMGRPDRRVAPDRDRPGRPDPDPRRGASSRSAPAGGS